MSKKIILVLLAGCFLALSACKSDGRSESEQTGGKTDTETEAEVSESLDNSGIVDDTDWKAIMTAEDPELEKKVNDSMWVANPLSSVLPFDPTSEEERKEFYESRIEPLGKEAIPYLIQYVEKSVYSGMDEEKEAMQKGSMEELALTWAHQLAGIEGYVGEEGCSVSYSTECEYEEGTPKYYAYQLKSYLLSLTSD